MNHRHLIALVVVALGAALIVPTTAAPDTVNDESLVFKPADGPNGAYAYYEDYRPGGGEEIRLGFGPSNPKLDSGDGVPADTVTSFDRVFTITNNGTEAAWVDLANNSDRVRFYVGDNVDAMNNNVTVAPDGTVAVGVVIDTRNLPESTTIKLDTTFSISAGPADGTPGEGSPPSENSGGDGDDGDDDGDDDNPEDEPTVTTQSSTTTPSTGTDTPGNTDPEGSTGSTDGAEATGGGGTTGLIQSLGSATTGPLAVLLGGVGLTTLSLLVILVRRRDPEDKGDSGP